jgi:hypothetical protein
VTGVYSLCRQHRAVLNVYGRTTLTFSSRIREIREKRKKRKCQKSSKEQESRTDIALAVERLGVEFTVLNVARLCWSAGER